MNCVGLFEAQCLFMFRVGKILQYGMESCSTGYILFGKAARSLIIFTCIFHC